MKLIRTSATYQCGAARVDITSDEDGIIATVETNHNRERFRMAPEDDAWETACKVCNAAIGEQCTGGEIAEIQRILEAARV